MEPNSITVIGMLLAGAGGLLYVLVRFRFWLVRIVSGTLAIVLAMGAGTAVVNDYYGYYQTWSQVGADLSGSYGNFTPPRAVSRVNTTTPTGRLQGISMPGATSGITRRGFVYLPPQYFQPRYRHTHFPVVELIHGTPGTPSAWIVHLNIVAIADRLIARHQMGPTVLVMPAMATGRNYQECVNAPGALDATYLLTDVRHVIQSKYRVSTAPSQWGIAGYSSGGYCAADLSLRNRSSFGAAGIMDGYFRPQDGQAAAALHYHPAAMAANDALRIAAALPVNVSPLPAYWLSAGTADVADIRAAHAFVAALHGVEGVPLYQEPNAGHNFYAWASAVPRMLSWMWTQLAPPDLRVQFPVAGPVGHFTLPAPGAAPHRRHHHRHHGVGARGPAATTPTAAPTATPGASRHHARSVLARGATSSPRPTTSS